MIVYSVYDINKIYKKACEKLPDLKWNTLLSYYYYNGNTDLELLYEHSSNLMLDSGAFTLFNKPDYDLDNFFSNYKKWVKQLTDIECVRGFMELDVGIITGYQQVLDYRQQLMDISDKIIPVFHSYLGIDEFKKMCNDYDYIAIGGIVSKEINKNTLEPLNKYAMKHNTKIHALGLTDEKYLRKIPFYSVDSSSYLVSKFGNTFIFNPDGSYWKPVQNKKKIHDENWKLRLKNYVEHIKFQQYYHNYWNNKGI